MPATITAPAARNLSINGFLLIAGTAYRFTLATLPSMDLYGVVTRTGSGAVLLRQADGSEREICQSLIVNIQDLTDAEWILFDQGTMI
jgi:hypothetical protein